MWSWVAFSMAAALIPLGLWMHRRVAPLNRGAKPPRDAWVTAVVGGIVFLTRFILLLTPVREIAWQALPPDLASGEELIQIFYGAEVILGLAYLFWVWSFLGRGGNPAVRCALYTAGLLLEAGYIFSLLGSAQEFE